MRSFRAENVSEFVKGVLDREVHTARASFDKLSDRYPIAITRDLDAAKEWARDHARGSERLRAAGFIEGNAAQAARGAE